MKKQAIHNLRSRGTALVVCAYLCLAETAGAQFVDMFPAPAPVTPRIHSEFTLEINIHNAGTRTSTNLLVVTNLLPAGWTLVSASVGTFRVGLVDGFQWHVNDPPVASGATQDGRNLSFRPHPIPAGWWRPIWIVARADTVGFFTNVVSINPGAGAPDANPANNTLAHVIEVRPPAVSVHGGQSAAEQSAGNLQFVVRLTGSNSVPVTVEYHTRDETARAGEDYQATSGTLTFPPGVLEQTVAVPVLDDALEENNSQWFTLGLTNAINADISAATDFNYILDDEPPLTVSIVDAAPVVKGDAGFASAVFGLFLSGVADVPVRVNFNVAQPLATNGTVTIPAGATNSSLVVLVPGNVTVESNRTVQVTLSNPTGTPDIGLGRAQAQGTILDDDALPGKFHHLEIAPVPSPQLAGRPFLLNVRARDYFSEQATNGLAGIELGAFVRVGSTYQQQWFVAVSNFLDGTATVSVTLTNPATNVIVGVWKPGHTSAFTPPFRVSPKPTIFLSAPGATTEGDGTPSAPGRVSITNIDVQDIVVQLSVSDSQELELPASLVIPAGQTSAVFSVTAIDDNRLDGSQNPTIVVSSPGYLSGAATTAVHDNETASLSLSLAPIHLEGAWATLGTVSVSSPVAVATGITITSDDPSEISLPNGAWIAVVQAGQTSASFYYYVRDDTLLDGPQPVTLTARVQNWIDGSVTTTVLDNDTNLVLNLVQENKQPIEGLGTRTNVLQVVLPGVAVNAVTVQLTSSDPTEVIVPPFVVVPAGLQSASTNLTYPDDTEFDGTQTVTLTATVPGLTPGTRTLTVPDNDLHHITLAPIPPNQTSGVPFRVSATVKDVNDATMFTYSEPLSLAAFRGATALSGTPAAISSYIRGTASGNVTVNGWGTNLHLAVTASNGVTALSNPFTIPTPSWVADVRILRIELNSPGLQLFFNTVTGLLYRVEMTPALEETPWLPLGAALFGTGGEVSIIHSNAPATSQRFYRLSVTP